MCWRRIGGHKICMGYISTGYVGTGYVGTRYAWAIWAQDTHRICYHRICRHRIGGHKILYAWDMLAQDMHGICWHWICGHKICTGYIKLYLDSRYVSSCEGVWRLFQFGMHEEFPNITRLHVHLPNQQTITWNAANPQNIQQVAEHQGAKDTTLTGYFKANARYPEACQLLYQDFPSKFVWNKKTLKWTPRQRGFSIGRMYYAHPGSGERFYLRTLLTVVKGATSFEDLRRVDGGDPLPTFHAACLARGLLEDDNEWRQCLQEASHMATGHQLRNLFVTILRDCSPSDPLALWVEFRVNICDDLHHALHLCNIIPDPTQDQVLDYGLYLVLESPV